MPSVSPKKSWVGSISGLIASLIVFYLFQKQGLLGTFFEFKDAIAIGLICGVIGQLGDFTESMLKKRRWNKRQWFTFSRPWRSFG